MLTEEQEKELIKASEPLMIWLNQHGHPHLKVIIDQVSLELLEGVKGYQTYDFADGDGRPRVTVKPSLSVVSKETPNEV